MRQILNAIQTNTRNIDIIVTVIPIVSVLLLSLFFFCYPNESQRALNLLHNIFTGDFGVFYLVFGLLVFIFSIYIASSKYGNITLGKKGEKPKYSFFAWGAMMFTCGLAADILFYSLSEWLLYIENTRVEQLGDPYQYAQVYSLFHWGVIPWSFYLVLAIAFGYMLHNKMSQRKKYSEALRPLLHEYVDKFPGKIIDIIAVFALLAGTATTFSVATPLMSTLINEMLHTRFNPVYISITIIIITCCIYTYSLLHGSKGINKLANICMYCFFILLLYVLFFTGKTRYILESGLTSLGLTIENFFELATYTDPLRTNNFPQDWTVYYWSYWVVWCVSAPFFIAMISKGRTIRQTILGGYVFGTGSTLLSFIILGNYSIGQQISNNANFIEQYQNSKDIYQVIVSIIKTMPHSTLVITLILLTMIFFYATSFDSIALTASLYSYTNLESNEQPSRLIQLIWCITLILLPLALLFSQSTLQNLQTVSIIAAAPLAIVITLIIVGFYKELTSLKLNIDPKALEA